MVEKRAGGSTNLFKLSHTYLLKCIITKIVYEAMLLLTTMLLLLYCNSKLLHFTYYTYITHMDYICTVFSSYYYPLITIF